VSVRAHVYRCTWSLTLVCMYVRACVHKYLVVDTGVHRACEGALVMCVCVCVCVRVCVRVCVCADIPGR